jgi:transposase
MPSRIGPVHVAITKRQYKGKEYRSYLLRRTYREGDKVKHETLGNISHLPLSVIDLIVRALKGEIFLGVDESFEITRSLPHGHVLAVLGAMIRLGLDKILGAKESRNKALVMGMIVARIIDPCSKLATARGLGEETLSTTLGDLLGIKSVQVEELYRSLDWLLGRQSRIESALASLYLSEGSLVLYDVTSTYFEGRKCPLAKLGHSRDDKKDKPQIVFGVLCNQEGCPVAVEVFEGNTSDPKTLGSQIEKIRSRFGLSRVVLVGDRGMITEARIREELAQEGFDWITALRAPSIRKLVNSGSLQLSVFDQRDMAEITDPSYPGERLIICKNPVLAEERARKREDLLRSTERDLEKIVQATLRPKRNLRGKERITRRVDKALDRFRMRKHFRVEIQDQSFSYHRDELSIGQEAALDGFYVIRTSLTRQALSTEDTVRAYKSLSGAERAFRSLKSVDLNVRPIYHRLPDRVKAHVLLCTLAYHVEWHMKKALAPILFEDDRKKAAEDLRRSVVQQAKRSQTALLKSRKRQTEDGIPVHSFKTMLRDLATLTRNTVHLKSTGASFTVCSTPTSLQKKAFELLGAPLKM